MPELLQRNSTAKGEVPSCSQWRIFKPTAKVVSVFIFGSSNVLNIQMYASETGKSKSSQRPSRGKKFVGGRFRPSIVTPGMHANRQALTRRPRRLEDRDRLVLKTIEISPASVVGRREPANRAAEESALHAGAALRRRVLLQERLSQPEDHPHLEKPALGSQPTGLPQAQPLRSLPRRPAPRNRSDQRQGSGHWPGQTGSSCTPCRPSCARRSRRA